MDILKAEIARKKKQIQDSAVLPSDKKYFKRKDLAAKQEEEYWKKSKKLKLLQEEEANSSGSNDEAGPSERSSARYHLPRKEVVRRLRERDEPIRLFGETDEEAFQRLKKLEILQPEVIKGFNNDLQSAMDQVDQAYLEEVLKTAGTEGEVTNDVKVKDTSWTIEEILEKAEKLGQGDAALDQAVILNFLKLLLKMWGDELNSRQLSEKRGFRGKLASATHTQTVAYIKPLFRKLKHKDVSPDILVCLVDIIRFLLNRHYIKANDAYLEMAIGNAPWPIGVTMVGIHARTGREKIFARNVAHVLNDETQRKYIQALKRLMTQCQKYFPTNPSRSVNFESEIH